MVKMILTYEKGQIIFNLINGNILLPEGCNLPNGLTADMISQAYNRHLSLGESTDEIYLKECLISKVI